MNPYRQVTHNPSYLGIPLNTPPEGCFEIILQRGSELLGSMISTYPVVQFNAMRLSYPNGFQVDPSLPNNRHPISSFKDSFSKMFHYLTGVQPYSLWTTGIDESNTQFFDFGYFINVTAGLPPENIHLDVTAESWGRVIGTDSYRAKRLIAHSRSIILNRNDENIFDTKIDVMNMFAQMAAANNAKRALPPMSRIFSSSKMQVFA